MPQKYFVLFVMWGCLGCTLYLIAGIELITSMFVSSFAPGFASLLTSLLTGAFAIALLFFSAFHLHLVLTGQSTIEASLSKRNARRAAEAAGGADAAAAQSLTHSSSNGDLEAQRAIGSVAAAVATLTVGQPSHPHPIHPHGPASFSAATKRENWDAVFGTDPWLWFVPVNTLHETGYEFDFLWEDEEEERGSGEGGSSREDPEASLSSHQQQQQQQHHSSRMAALASGLQSQVAQHVVLSVDDSDEAEVLRRTSPSSSQLRYEQQQQQQQQQQRQQHALEQSELARHEHAHEAEDEYLEDDSQRGSADSSQLHLADGLAHLDDDSMVASPSGANSSPMRSAHNMQYPPENEEQMARSSLVRTEQ